MKEIKYRAWDKEQKTMWTVSSLYPLEKTADVFRFEINRQTGKEERISNFRFDYPEHLVLMQFTSLKDKNGKKIYKEDIVNLESPFLGDMKGETIQGDSGEWLIHKSSGNYVSVYHNRDKIEVIGNIYENPKLLEKK